MAVAKTKLGSFKFSKRRRDEETTASQTQLQILNCSESNNTRRESGRTSADESI